MPMVCKDLNEALFFYYKHFHDLYGLSYQLTERFKGF